jgi:hypothetical protein
LVGVVEPVEDVGVEVCRIGVFTAFGVAVGVAVDVTVGGTGVAPGGVTVREAVAEGRLTGVPWLLVTCGGFVT